MADRDLLPSSRIAILGLGLMGGSLALALRGRCRELLAADPDPHTRALARQNQVVDIITDDPGSILPQADVIVLAAPVEAILDLLSTLPELHPASAIVLDLGSSKVRICQAMENLPARFDPVGGHPMCGKERLGLSNADPRLYRGAAFAFTPLERTSDRVREFASQLAQAVGARPLWLDAAAHDRWVAATSHLPYLVSSALVMATPLEAAPLVGPGFRSASRLASTPHSMMSSVLVSNQDEVLAALRLVRGQLDLLEACLASGDTGALNRLLQASQIRQRELVSA